MTKKILAVGMVLAVALTMMVRIAVSHYLRLGTQITATNQSSDKDSTATTAEHSARPKPPAGKPKLYKDRSPATLPVSGTVWVNTETATFYRKGDEWYGKTKHGKYMTEADASKSGYTEANEVSP